jgi:hypothetical protein
MAPQTCRAGRMRPIGKGSDADAVL